MLLYEMLCGHNHWLYFFFAFAGNDMLYQGRTRTITSTQGLLSSQYNPWHCDTCRTDVAGNV